MDAVPFAIVGGGWRSQFYLRVARELPGRFRVTGLLTRDPARAGRLSAEWGVAARASLDELLLDRPAFVVLSVPWAATPGLLAELADRDVAVLSEAPPAPDVQGLERLRDLDRRGARIQVGEQYQFQPLHAARLAIAASGRLGTISQAQLSVAHGYHGIDLLRRLLRVGFDAVSITARVFTSPLLAGPDRGGPPREESLVESIQTIATFDFAGRLGILDFSDDQYFSWIRSPRFLVRGERGEINGATVRYLVDPWTPVRLELTRSEAGQDGNLEGLFLRGISAGETMAYENPFAPGRLTDDEIAVATCLHRMAEFLEGGPGFCDLADGVHDQYLSLLVDEAARTANVVRAQGHLWRGSGPR